MMQTVFREHPDKAAFPALLGVPRSGSTGKQYVPVNELSTPWRELLTRPEWMFA